MATKTYDTIQEWMERKRVNGERLIEMLHERGVEITKGHLSNILKGSRRCSLKLALELHDLTGVPIKSIARWPISEKLNSRSAA